MVEMSAACVIAKGELDEVKSPILLEKEELLLFIEHPLHIRKRFIKLHYLLAEPFPVASVEDQDTLL